MGTDTIILLTPKPPHTTAYNPTLKNLNYPFNKALKKKAGVLIVLQLDQQALETASELTSYSPCSCVSVSVCVCLYLLCAIIVVIT